MGSHGTLVSISPPIVADCAELGLDELDLDKSAFDHLAAEIGREETLETFLIFFTEAHNRLQRLKELSCDAERNAIRQEAHGLKGSAGNFGLPRVSELARRLERDAQIIASVDYEVALRSLETSYANALALFANLTK